LKNIPFFSPTALRSLKKERGGGNKGGEGGRKEKETERSTHISRLEQTTQHKVNFSLNNHTGNSQQKLFDKTMPKLFIL
jgi:hypothetical protein